MMTRRLAECLPLKGSEHEYPVTIGLQHKIDESIAETANAVKKEYVFFAHLA